MNGRGSYNYSVNCSCWFNTADYLPNFMNKSVNCSSECEHSMNELLSDHQIPLSIVCIASIVLGLPLKINMFWHLKVANNTSGRGVLRLTRLHVFINLICFPMICADLIILASPSNKIPLYLCGCLEWVITFMWVNGSFRGLMIALGR